MRAIKGIVMAGSMSFLVGVSVITPAGELLPVQPLYALDNGDTNGDWERDLSDGIYLLNHLFAGGPEPVPIACGPAPSAVQNGDSNGDRALDLSDAIHLLTHLFTGGQPPAPCDGNLAGGGGINPRVVPVNARAHGKSYGEWSGQWWAWAFSIPAGSNPILDATGEHCDEGQTGNVWFLAGAFSSDPLARSCTVPLGKAVFFPIINIECSTLEPPPFFGSNEEELLECATGFFDDAADVVTCTVDGVDLKEVKGFRVQSPATPFTASVDNILGVPAGSNGLLVSDGYWIMLPPLPKGEHVIHWTGVLGSGPFAGFSQDVTWNLTVE